jgi:glycosyltransferase involved in cell wall biosynthesis
MSDQPARRKISVIIPCLNEMDNVQPLHAQLRAIFERLGTYDYEVIFIDNASTDRTVEVLRAIAGADKNVKVIVNTRNFGHIRSPYHALMQCTGDACIAMAADFQDPPELVPEFIAKWEAGYKIAVGVKAKSDETFVMWIVRGIFYRILARLSDIRVIKNATGFGIYDRVVIESLRRIDDPYPYFRGLLADVGFEAVQLPYHQPVRKRGLTKNNFYTLYDLAMLGITNHSKVPLRLATIFGFVMAIASLTLAIGYLVAKLIWWDRFQLGMAPILVGVFFFSSIQLFFTGVIGEYVGAIHTQVQKRPLVVEKERINF